mgnify:CR=1 FL=1
MIIPEVDGLAVIVIVGGVFAAKVKPDPSQNVWSELDQKRQEIIFEIIETTLADGNAQNHPNAPRVLLREKFDARHSQNFCRNPKGCGRGQKRDDA